MNAKRLKQLATLQKLKAQEKQKYLPPLQQAQAALHQCQTHLKALLSAKEMAHSHITQEHHTRVSQQDASLSNATHAWSLPDSLIQNHHHIQWLEHAILETQAQHSKLQAEVNALQEPVMRLAREEKQLEMLQERIHETHQLELNKKETLLLEEFSLRSFLLNPPLK